MVFAAALLDTECDVFPGIRSSGGQGVGACSADRMGGGVPDENTETGSGESRVRGARVLVFCAADSVVRHG